MIDNPSFETSDDTNIWAKWMESADDGFAGDEGYMTASFKVVPERGLDAIGSVRIYVDGWTTLGMTHSADGTYKFYVNSKRRPRWAKGMLHKLWYWWVSR